MKTLKILSGGAAQGLIENVAETFKTLSGYTIDGDFGAVGTIAAKVRDGAQADMIILTRSIVADLTRQGFLRNGSAQDIGNVETAIAVRAGDPTLPIENSEALRRTFLAADAIFVPDTKSSTAGIHIAKILDQLGIADQVDGRLKIFPNGATAMRHLAASEFSRPLGCTQSTEIINTPGLTLVGALPPECALATVYSAAATTQAAHVSAVETLIRLLTAVEQRALRYRIGFLDLP